VKALLLLLLGASAAAAGRLERYTPAAFSSQQQKDAYILLQFNSDSCTVCPRQEISLQRLASESSQPAVRYFKATFEVEDELKKLYGVSAMSTLLVFRGRYLIGRSAGLYTEDEIRAFLHKSMLEDRGKPKGRPKRKYGPKR